MDIKKVWWLFVLFVFASVVYAQSETFSVKISPDKVSVRTNETAEYDLTIINSAGQSQIFEVYSPDIIWDVRTDRPLFVPPNKQFKAQLFIHALNVNPGLYGVPLTVRKVGSADSVKQSIFIELKSLNVPMNTYLPAFRGNASMPRRVDPGKEVLISLNIENLNRRNLTDVSVKIRSNMINKDYLTSLEPREKKLLTFTAFVDNSVLPQRDLLKIYVLKSENDKSYQYEVNPLQYEVLPIENVVVNEEFSNRFLKTTYSARIMNKGNVPKDVVHSKEFGFFKRLFSRTNPSANVVSGGYKWVVRLDVNEERVVSVITNYLPAFISLVVVVLFVLLYFLLRAPLWIKKTAVIVSAKEGGISEMKIRVRIKNRSKKVVRKINLIDLVPRIAEVDKTFDSGTPAPAQIIKNDKKGTLLKWHLDHLGGGEEYIFTYCVKAKYAIIGGATLPVAVAKFVSADGKERTTFSNRFKVNALA